MTYTCNVRPDPMEQLALVDFVRRGGRWLALHGTHSAIDPRGPDSPVFRTPRVLGEVADAARRPVPRPPADRAVHRAGDGAGRSAGARHRAVRGPRRVVRARAAPADRGAAARELHRRVPRVRGGPRHRRRAAPGAVPQGQRRASSRSGTAADASTCRTSARTTWAAATSAAGPSPAFRTILVALHRLGGPRRARRTRSDTVTSERFHLVLASRRCQRRWRRPA